IVGEPTVYVTHIKGLNEYPTFTDMYKKMLKHTVGCVVYKGNDPLEAAELAEQAEADGKLFAVANPEAVNLKDGKNELYPYAYNRQIVLLSQDAIKDYETRLKTHMKAQAEVQQRTFTRSSGSC